MCGIVGAITNGQESFPAGQLLDAVASLRHRGPERQGQWSDENGRVLLGHARLCIIDPDERSDQPFHYGGRYVLVYNGEIYNYVELREELRASGCSFHTGSDTEVLAAAWAAWGPACLPRLDGAFAFGIWDKQERAFYAARDRFGEKPLFFLFDEGYLGFASEMKALWKLGAPRRPDPAMVYNFLSLGYTVNPFDAAQTFFLHIQKLPAGSFLRLEQGATHYSVEAYGQIDIEVDESIDDETAIARFRELFAASVRRRLRSDVPIGTSLSGGLDSSAVAALCRQAGGAHYTHKAFTAIFPGFERDERALSAHVARHLGIDQQFVEIRPDEVPALMDRVMRYQEEPVGSASALAQFRVFETARAAGVTVLLDGQGADEVLAGYDKYYRWYWRELYAARRLGSSGELEAARKLGVKEPFGAASKLSALLPYFSAAILEGSRSRQAAAAPDLNPEWAQAQKRHLHYMVPPQPTLNAVLHYNTFTNGLEELLRLADRNGMAHSLEVRLPFLSSELVAFLFTLPPRFKIREGRTKWLLRKAVEDLLPPEIVWQSRKIGFEPPQQLWMQQAAVQEAIRAAKEKLVGAGVLAPSVLQKKIQPHSAYAAVNRDWKYWSLSYLY
ncbi:asparagine synthase (glutamine-hydrolyzing) [Flaviaesturariibacter flavus]|uniref:asparagine synthase (glutamine-hydrolyzing) n=1 Tax=Flaviaesturariibacter flavus TaxID=2502780 RepID=A0A4R1B9H1_9BACT|nr:asparagine synthase (glutamine-hydrolyzing) [Flaviaesturariibacter flavus]TCJ13548.1 asparagine synthase (glutamine-hydrolyzing) [Flaviaesturariibacter flavus]